MYLDMLQNIAVLFVFHFSIYMATSNCRSVLRVYFKVDNFIGSFCPMVSALGVIFHLRSVERVCISWNFRQCLGWENEFHVRA